MTDITEFAFGPHSYMLAAYSVTDQDTITLLDTLDLPEGNVRKPNVDRQSGLIYIPCETRGIYVVHFEDTKLKLVNTLNCVPYALSLAVVSQDTLYVCDVESNSVCMVDTTLNKVTAILWDNIIADTMAFLGDTVLMMDLVQRGLLFHRHGVSNPGKILYVPIGLSKLATDHVSSFLLMGDELNNIFVLNTSGNITHTIPFSSRGAVDCSVVEGQLWVGREAKCYNSDTNGEIVVLS